MNYSKLWITNKIHKKGSQPVHGNSSWEFPTTFASGIPQLTARDFQQIYGVLDNLCSCITWASFLEDNQAPFGIFLRSYYQKPQLDAEQSANWINYRMQGHLQPMILQRVDAHLQQHSKWELPQKHIHCTWNEWDIGVPDVTSYVQPTTAGPVKRYNVCPERAV